MRMSGGLVDQLPALVGGGVAGAHRHPDVRLGQAQPVRGVPDPGQRGPQVPLDVHRQRLERRDVEHPGAPLRVGGRRQRGQLVDRPQERGQRLARPGRRDDQRVLALADRPPGPGLRLRRLGERPVEPRPGGRREPVQRAVRRGGSAPASIGAESDAMFPYCLAPLTFPQRVVPPVTLGTVCALRRRRTSRFRCSSLGCTWKSRRRRRRGGGMRLSWQAPLGMLARRGRARRVRQRAVRAIVGPRPATAGATADRIAIGGRYAGPDAPRPRAAPPRRPRPPRPCRWRRERVPGRRPRPARARIRPPSATRWPTCGWR